MRQTFVLLLTLFHVPSRNTTRRFCRCSAPVKLGWFPLFSEGRPITTPTATMATMPRKRPIQCAIRSNHRRIFMTYLPNSGALVDPKDDRRPCLENPAVAGGGWLGDLLWPA